MRTQRKVLYVGNYLNLIFGPFCCSITGFFRFMCMEEVAHLNHHPFSPIFDHFNPFFTQFCCAVMATNH